MKKYTAPKPGDRFLWVRFGGVGDIVQALTDAYYVKKRFPGIKLYFLTEEKCACMIDSQSYLDGIIGGYKKPISVFLATLKLLREKKFDWVATTHKGTHLTTMFYLAGIKNRLGCSSYVQFLNSANIYKWAKAYGFDLFSRPEKSLFPSKEATNFSRHLLLPLEGKKKIFCVIGASIPQKLWPTAHWIEFLKPLAAEGWGIVLNGYGEKEQNIANEIVCNLPKESVANLVGKLNYENMIGAASECQIAVGNDTGPLHIAALCGVPSVGIFDYIQPPEVGYNMPWLTFAVARAEKLQTFYNKRRNSLILAEIKPETVREKFDELVKRCQI